MTIPPAPLNGRQSALPAPELVSLPEDAAGAHSVVQAPWWVRDGGTLGTDGMVTFPSVASVGCTVADCPTCPQLGWS